MNSYGTSNLSLVAMFEISGYFGEGELFRFMICIFKLSEQFARFIAFHNLHLLAAPCDEHRAFLIDAVAEHVLIESATLVNIVHAHRFLFMR